MSGIAPQTRAWTEAELAQFDHTELIPARPFRHGAAAIVMVGHVRLG